MAEIPRFFAEQQLQRRSGPVRTAGAGANLQTISGGGAGTGQGTAAFGQALSRLGSQLAVQNERFQRARAGIMSVEAMSQAFEEMGALEAEIVQDQSIFPTDRADAFRDRFEPRIAELKDTVPLLGQEAFLRGVNNAFLRSERNMRNMGRKEAIQRAQAELQEAQDLALFQAAEVRAGGDFAGEIAGFQRRRIDRELPLQLTASLLGSSSGVIGGLSQPQGLNTRQSLGGRSLASRRSFSTGGQFF